MKLTKLLILASTLTLLAGCSAKDAGTAATAAPTAAATRAAVQTEAAPAIAETGALTIPLADLTGDMQLFSQEMDGVRVEVIALIASDGSVRTAFNACQVCYDSGKGYYEQVGEKLVCQNCGNQFALDQLGLTAGGCNPVPITDAQRADDGTNLTISSDALKAGEVYFEYRTN